MSYDPCAFSHEIPIETSQDREFCLWAEQLGTAPVVVKLAVAEVGHSAEAVRDFLRRSERPQTSKRCDC